jgi:hypothetical protein
MVTGKKERFRVRGQLFLRGKKRVFCGSFRLVRAARGYVKCRNRSCGRTKSLQTRVRTILANIPRHSLKAGTE